MGARGASPGRFRGILVNHADLPSLIRGINSTFVSLRMTRGERYHPFRHSIFALPERAYIHWDPRQTMERQG
jgi:hypothetical protein